MGRDGELPAIGKLLPQPRTWVQSKNKNRTSLEVQWMGTCLTMQGTQVQALVQDDSTLRETKSDHHCY